MKALKNLFGLFFNFEKEEEKNWEYLGERTMKVEPIFFQDAFSFIQKMLPKIEKISLSVRIRKDDQVFGGTSPEEMLQQLMAFRSQPENDRRLHNARTQFVMRAKKQNLQDFLIETQMFLANAKERTL